ncbi:SNF2 family N-terminal domain-containing protein [Gilbertella persicaria]|uniref:SNF2 family N-terminal domain-containing protein n=1 Tax=Gilbertella persicaria TaxID=101096 RepID=UPI00221E47FC|nr:SNF2 family N-terminal domain-containing protein [Gilbertella persicaria]KAI8079061.1 SNF2 family N-terminal domain-containing protein [Gilbertella persicaria]
MTDTDNASKSSSSEVSSKQPRLTKRAKQIEEKLKNKTATSLFDTDGDLSRRNIIEGGRRNRKRPQTFEPVSSLPQTLKRKRTTPTPPPKPTSKPTIKAIPKGAPKRTLKLTSKTKVVSKRARTTTAASRKVKQSFSPPPLPPPPPRPTTMVIKKQTMPIIQNAREKLLLTPISEQDTSRNDEISKRLKQMEIIQQHHNASVKELYHLELFQNILEYNPNAFINDVRYNKYMDEYDMWERLRQNESFTSTIQDPSLIDLLQSAIYESAHISNKQENDYVNTIHTGTGLRRINRQFATLEEYLNSFYAADEGMEDNTPEAREAYIEKERKIRQRLYDLERRGGFSTELQQIAHRRPFHPPQKHTVVHDHLLTDITMTAKNFHTSAKYRRNAARRCAKAVERYWDQIRTHDERIEREETKRLIRLAKWTSQQIKKKWKVVERVCEARHKEILKEQQAREGRRHLELILEHSEQMLGVRKEELRQYQPESEANEKEHIIQESSASRDDESSALEREQDLSIEELMDKYHNENENEEYDMTDEEQDVPIEEDGQSEDDDEELDALNDEAELSVEELLQKYNYQLEEQTLPQETEKKEIQPTGNTLATTKVSTPIPHLLRGTLREYQHVGLDWLASLYNNGLNGILADEMGLGKTIQTISLLAYLACEKKVWGPHLIVVPTSVILNWEMEFKKWLPGFKIMAYYGSPKERKEKRSGWSKDNAFHVCITSYQLVLQDQNVFRRKAWHYLILDEAHHIKNFRSQRWQVLLNFNSKRRLLLTGTPLQNNLMELWSLLYFLMPNGVSQDMPIGFANLKEFQEWFSHPVDRMIENHQEYGVDEESKAAIQKLHTVLRPYLLRRLKLDVEKQMPEKHEHIVYCRLSKRQRFLYDDFMSRGKTKETLASGNFLSIINCLMQLRKVCNHPDLFEERPILTSFAMDDSVQFVGQLLESFIRKRFASRDDTKVNLGFLNLILTDTQNNAIMSQTVAQEVMRLEASKEIFKTIAAYQKRIATSESRSVNSLKNYYDLKKYAKYREAEKIKHTISRWERINYINHFRCARRPLYDASLLQMISPTYAFSHHPRRYFDYCDSVCHAVQPYKDRIQQHRDVIEEFGFVTPKAVVPATKLPIPKKLREAHSVENDIFHTIESRLSIAFPDKRLLQYDCGKLQKLDKLLRDLAAGGHRALIFTQMTRVLDVLEIFLNMHGHRYLRLDGATKVEQRQVLTEHFNNDRRILCFILSTRSGGLGINLTGADTVIFYDSDWNPSMDKQCQDRAHRIGQTRDVHIYRFVTEFTIEENIFKKANQKRMLDNVIIQEGDFTDDYFNKNEWWKDLPEVVGANHQQSQKSIDYEQALLQAEDENDAAAAIVARNEMDMDENEFDEQTQQPSEVSSRPMSPSSSNAQPSREQSIQPSEEQIVQPSREQSVQKTNDDESADEEDMDEQEEDDMQLDVGHVDQYMLQFWEREMVGINLGFGSFPPEEES